MEGDGKFLLEMGGARNLDWFYNGWMGNFKNLFK